MKKPWWRHWNWFPRRNTETRAYEDDEGEFCADRIGNAMVRWLFG